MCAVKKVFFISSLVWIFTAFASSASAELTEIDVLKGEAYAALQNNEGTDKNAVMIGGNEKIFFSNVDCYKDRQGRVSINIWGAGTKLEAVIDPKSLRNIYEGDTATSLYLTSGETTIRWSPDASVFPEGEIIKHDQSYGVFGYFSRSRLVVNENGIHEFISYTDDKPSALALVAICNL